MKKEIRQVSEDGKIVQITIADERWYIKTEYDENNVITGIKEVPSVSWVSDYYPKGIGFYKYIADKGWDNAEKIKNDAGNRGSLVHSCITSLLLGNELKMDDKYPDPDTGEMREATLEEYECLMSFVEWFKEAQPKTLQNEITVFNDKHNYAGTADYICEIKGERWLIDFKTGKEVWPSYELQVSAYKHALPADLAVTKMAILQLGYKKNKYKKFKFTEIPDQFDLFLAAQLIWKKECSEVSIFKKDYPVTLSLS